MGQISKRNKQGEFRTHGGKWLTGFGSILTGAYKARRKKQTKKAKRARSLNAMRRK